MRQKDIETTSTSTEVITFNTPIIFQESGRSGGSNLQPILEPLPATFESDHDPWLIGSQDPIPHDSQIPSSSNQNQNDWFDDPWQESES